jgi:homoserine dehydrogenase
VAGALGSQRERLASRYGLDVTVVGAASAGREIAQAASAGGRIKHVATLGFAGPGGAGNVTARVQPELVGHDDPLVNVNGTTNAVVFEADPVGQVTITGPGAGPQLAGQGVLSDIIAVSSRRAAGA